jgi:hypothetical protein
MARMDLNRLLEAEMLLERTSALARLGERIQRGIEEAQGLAEQLRAEPPGPTRDRLLQLHQEARGRVERDRYYLVIQREALGMTEHAVVDEIYPMPRAVR